MPALAGTSPIMYADYGMTFTRGIVKKDSKRRVVPLTGYTANMQIKTSAEATTALLTLTTENGYLTIDAPRGLIAVEVPADVMETLPVGTYAFDVEIYDADGVKERLVKGPFVVRAG